MPLYLADKKATLFKGEHKPVRLYLGDKKVTGYEYANSKGEHIEFEGTYNDTASIVINGKSEQVQTEQGKNLLDREFIVGYFNDDILTPGAKYRSFDGDVLLPAGTYTFSRPGGDFNIVRIRLNGITTNISGWFCTFTISEPTYVNFSWRNGTNTDWLYGENSADAELQLELGSTATDYEPFVPNSPSPEYPSEIKSVGDDGGFDLVSAGRNIFDFTKTTSPQITLLENGYQINGSYATKTGIEAISFLKPNTTYTCVRTFNGTINASNGTLLFIDISYSKPSFTVGAIGAGRLLRVFTTPEDLSGYMLYVYGTSGETTTMTDIMIVKGAYTDETIPPYELFRGIQTARIPYTLRGQGDVRDTMEYLGGDRWRRTQRVGKVVLNGSEDIRPRNIKEVTACFRINLGLEETSNDGLSSHFQYYHQEWDWVNNRDTVGIAILNHSIWIKIPKSLAEDVDTFKAWLSAQHAAGTPVTVYYQLAEPIITEFTAPAPQTFYGYTQFYTTGSDISPGLDVMVRVIDQWRLINKK